jgi:hypothetical protein
MRGRVIFIRPKKQSSLIFGGKAFDKTAKVRRLRRLPVISFLLLEPSLMPLELEDICFIAEEDEGGQSLSVV